MRRRSRSTHSPMPWPTCSTTSPSSTMPASSLRSSASMPLRTSAPASRRPHPRPPCRGLRSPWRIRPCRIRSCGTGPCRASPCRVRPCRSICRPPPSGLPRPRGPRRPS
jgi:hypothetical protein